MSLERNLFRELSWSFGTSSLIVFYGLTIGNSFGAFLWGLSVAIFQKKTKPGFGGKSIFIPVSKTGQQLWEIGRRNQFYLVKGYNRDKSTKPGFGGKSIFIPLSKSGP